VLGAASIAVGPSAILTGSQTRPSDWGWNGRFGLVEDRRNNHKDCHGYLYSPDLVAVTFTFPFPKLAALRTRGHRARRRLLHV